MAKMKISIGSYRGSHALDAQTATADRSVKVQTDGDCILEQVVKSCAASTSIVALFNTHSGTHLEAPIRPLLAVSWPDDISAADAEVLLAFVGFVREVIWMRECQWTRLLRTLTSVSDSHAPSGS